MSKTSTLAEVIDDSITNRLAQLHVCLPGRVESYDATKRQISVKPLLVRRLRDNREIEFPIINNVPVVWPGTVNAVISLPLTKGDTVALLFNERSLDEWLSSGTQVTPSDKRLHDISDAIAIPGLFAFNSDNGADGTDLKIRFKNSVIRITPTGDVKITGGPAGKVAMGNEQEELLDLFNQLLTLLIASTTATSIGNQPLSVVADITILKADLAKIKGVL